MSARNQPFRKLFRVAPWYVEDSRLYRVNQFLVSNVDAAAATTANADEMAPPPGSGAATAMQQVGSSKFIGKQTVRVQNSANRYAGNVFVRPAEEGNIQNQGTKYLMPSPFEYQNANDFIRQFGYARIRR